ncbi:pLS20_p028 family conjugation system transmembrane protein [Enterococcus hirae]|uniref:pLS20_p028 family conjugation system transmembrane protein n=1 Tax=Enterococcus hirae TaxID=1354 RepID=UPI003458CEAA
MPFILANVVTNFLSGNSATVMSNEQLLKLLNDYSGYLTQGNPIWDTLRPIGMKIAEGGAWVLDGLYGVMGNLLNLLNIFDNPAFTELMHKIDPLKGFLLLMAVVGFFILLMFNKVNGATQAPLNLLLILCLTLMAPALWSTASTMTQGVFKAINKVDQGPGESIILENTTDLVAVAEEGWKLKDGENLNHYKHANQINMQEKIEKPEDVKNGEVFKKEIQTDYKGKESVIDIEQPSGFAAWLMSKFFSPNYYRNKVHFFNIYLTELVSIVALAITSFKFAIIIVKMYGDYVLLVKGGLADFMGMQRVKAVFSELVGSFALLVYVPILFQIYIVATVYIKSMNFDFFTYIIAMAGAAWALIDGPNGFQRVTGIDAGLKGTAGVMMAAFSGSKLARGVKDFGLSAAKSAGGALADVGAFGLGMSLATAGAGNNGNGKGLKGINDMMNGGDSDSENKEEDDSKSNKGFNEQAREKDQSKDSNDLQNQESSENEESSTESEGVGENTQETQETSESSPESSDFDSLESLEPTEADINSDYPLGFNEMARQGVEGLEETTNSADDLNSYSFENEEAPLSANNEKENGFNQESDDQKSSKNEEKPKRTFSAKSDRFNQELSQHKKNNPLKQATKNKVFGYGKEDPRRYHSSSFMSKRRDAYDLGKDYGQYRQQKRRIKGELKESKKEEKKEE